MINVIITNSPDLGVLEVKVSIDLTGVNPVINLTNQTTANPNASPTPTLDTIQWVLNIYSPTGTPIYQSDFDTPWKTGVWTTEQITAAWPRPFGQIEWSGADYRIEFQVKDTVGTIYDLFKSATICRPTGNTQKSTNTYGTSLLTVEVMCDTASLYIKDNTSKTYKGLTGILASTYLAVDYPRDPTGVRPDPFVITSFTTDALVPFTYNGNGYEATYYSIYTYDLGDNVFLQIRYTAQVSFAVQCNIDLCPIACEVKALEDSIANGSCGDIQAAQNKLNLITPKLLRAFIAKAEPTCGMDLPALVEEIIAIGGFNCDCYGASTGIGSQSALIDGLLFSVNNQGGDVVASFSTTGNNVTLNIKDRSYTFGPQSGASILLVPTVGATNTDVQLQISMDDFAEDIYNATANSAYLLNLFNSLVINGGFTLQVDGKCIISNGACDFTWTLSNIPSFGSAFLVYITVNGSNQPINYAFNTTTLTAFQTYLNTLALGTFVVTDDGGGVVIITSTSNSAGLSNFIYTDGGPKKIALLVQDCSGFSNLTPNQIVQAIIDYICDLDDSQVKTSQEYTICYFDPATKTAKTSVVPVETSLTEFIIELLARGCDTITYMENNGGGNDCASIQALFPASINVLQANDKILGTKTGDCAGIGPVELGSRILQLGLYDADFMLDFCAAVQACSGGYMCEPYSVFTLSTVENSPIDNKLDIIVTFTHPASTSNLIRYTRIDQGGTLNWSVPASVLPGDSPYTIADVDDGQYRVGITPVYADGRRCSEVTLDTTVCGTVTSFSSVFSGGDITVTYSATSEKVRVIINYPNGGQFSQIYTTGASIVITPPADLFGVFSLTMQPVCSSSTGWFGASTAPSIVEVTPAANSTIVNNTSYILTNLKVWYVGVDNLKVLIATVPALAVGGNLSIYVGDGFYNSFGIQIDTGTIGQGNLTTDTGVTVGVVSDGTQIEFLNVDASGGIDISLLDSSP